MKEKTLSIHSENILPIIKKWLYSEKDIFLRELVSNAVDAISKLRLLQSEKKAKESNDPFRIDIKIDKEKNTVTISDNGIGMSEEEIEKYISQIAFSGAEDFLKHYQTNQEKDQIIGHFGLGFYSAYMVAKKVEIHTKSFEEKKSAVFWSCDGSSNYSLDSSDKQTIGTDIILHLEDTAYLDEAKIKSILLRFCPFIPYGIYLNDTHNNNKDPLYLQSPAEIKDQEYIDFYHELYPEDLHDPIFWIHLNVEVPFHLKGILFFPKIDKNFDFQKSNIRLFCNRVFVSDNCKDILPDFLTILKGAIDSPDIPLNVSRSYLQVDQTVRQLGQHVAKKIADRLVCLFNTDRKKLESIFEDIETIFKLGILQDDKFYERTKKALLWKNTKKEWTTLEEYVERKGDKTIFYTQDHTQFLEFYKKLNIEVLFANAYVDTTLMTSLERKNGYKFQRIDGNIDPSILDPSKEQDLMDASGKTERIKIAEFIQSALDQKDLQVEAKSLADGSIPGFLLIKEEERRFRDYMQITQNQSFPSQKTFVVNTNNPLVKKAQVLTSSNPDLAKSLISHLYDLTKISQKEMPPEELNAFLTRSTELLDKLIN